MRHLCPQCGKPPKLVYITVRNRASRVQKYHCEPCLRWWRRGQLVDSLAPAIAAEVAATEAEFFADEALIQALQALRKVAEDARYRRIFDEDSQAKA